MVYFELVSKSNVETPFHTMKWFVIVNWKEN
jgi:hypothetical protein